MSVENQEALSIILPILNRYSNIRITEENCKNLKEVVDLTYEEGLMTKSEKDYLENMVNH